MNKEPKDANIKYSVIREIISDMHEEYCIDRRSPTSSAIGYIAFQILNELTTRIEKEVIF